jgi:hypothetical protein
MVDYWGHSYSGWCCSLWPLQLLFWPAPWLHCMASLAPLGCWHCGMLRQRTTLGLLPADGVPNKVQRAPDALPAYCWTPALHTPVWCAGVAAGQVTRRTLFTPLCDAAADEQHLYLPPSVTHTCVPRCSRRGRAWGTRSRCMCAASLSTTTAT